MGREDEVSKSGRPTVEVLTCCKAFYILMSIIFLIGIIVAVLGWRYELRHSEKCTYTTAMLIETEQDSYKWVPRYGGRIQTKFEYFHTYEFMDSNGEYYRFTVTTYNAEKVLELSVRYEEGSPDKFEFNANQLYNCEGEQWVYYK